MKVSEGCRGVLSEGFGGCVYVKYVCIRVRVFDSGHFDVSRGR